MKRSKQIRKICLIVAIIVIVMFVATAASFLAGISPLEDDIDVFDYPPEFFCKTEENHIDYQTDGKCSAYATAYLLRHFGENADGEELFSEFKRPFGFVSAKNVTNVFVRHGYQAKACRGNVDTLKQRLLEGNPIIVFIKIPSDTHYAVVVGYDERYIYLADSLFKNADTTSAQHNRYNRVMTMKDFETVWKTGTPLPDNIYIVVSRKQSNAENAEKPKKFFAQTCA